MPSSIGLIEGDTKSAGYTYLADRRTLTFLAFLSVVIIV